MGAERGGTVALRVVDVAPRQRLLLTGLVTAVRRSEGYGGSLEADLEDGTGSVTLVFFGRVEMEGMEPGACLTVAGRALAGPSRTEVLNPSYEFLPAPRDG